MDKQCKSTCSHILKTPVHEWFKSTGHASCNRISYLLQMVNETLSNFQLVIEGKYAHVAMEGQKTQH